MPLSDRAAVAAAKRYGIDLEAFAVMKLEQFGDGIRDRMVAKICRKICDSDTSIPTATQVEQTTTFTRWPLPPKARRRFEMQCRRIKIVKQRKRRDGLVREQQPANSAVTAHTAVPATQLA